MVKKSLLFLAASLLLMLGGCGNFSGTSAGKIIPPPGQTCPLGGKWTVLQELGADGNPGDEAQQWEGTSVQFAAGAVSFGGHVWDNLSYKIKRVNGIDYLMTKYVPLSGISISESQEVDVITVYAASNFLGEVMKLDDARMIFFVQNKELLLEKVSDQADSLLGAADRNAQDLIQDGSEGASGILLGLREPGDSGYTYRTLWIAADHRQLRPVLAADRLFFPRTSGFWELRVEDISSEGKEGNLLSARNVTAKTIEREQGEDKEAVRDIINLEKNKSLQTGAVPEGDSALQAAVEPAVRIIEYLGNDYVAVEKETGRGNQLQMLPIDKLSSTAEIKVSDLLGDEGRNAYLNARERAAAALRDKMVTSVDEDESGENFGLMRKNGHWFLVGRINYQSGGTFQQSDFDLKVIPPASLIFYDTLVLSWHHIKDRVPDAMDAFTSPNKDIALVKTKNKLLIYPIGAEQLAETPSAEIDLPEGTSVVMAEWATGSYVESWERSFLSYGAQHLTGASVRIR